MIAFRVLDPGPMTTVQDLGRVGFQALGIPISGALDLFSAKVANWLVGNPAGAGVLEATFMGPKLEVLGEFLVAVTGADVTIRVNGREELPWSAFRVQPGDELWIKQATRGLRAYIAVTGGIDVPLVMGSRSTYVPARLGGFQGRPLAKGDLIQRCQGDAFRRPRVLPAELRPVWTQEVIVRAVPGPQDDHFDEGMKVFFSSVYQVTPQADRMGYRLEGPPVVRKPQAPASIISEPTMPGAVQIPPDGKPIVLMVEQTVGGYSKIATVITPDISFIAQARPKDRIRFLRIDLPEAHTIYRQHQYRLEEIRSLLKAPS